MGACLHLNKFGRRRGLPAHRRGRSGGLEIALILVGPQGRWQLPKGLVNAGETPETAALREVAEEAGIETALVEPIDVIEYWYYGSRGAQKVRFHKQVHFFLLEYVAGDVANHDDEVEEARWVGFEAAKAMLSFASERKVVEKAEQLLARRLALLT